ncbi:MAG: M56 family metallopeptidase [Intestinimonas sp.]
MTDLWSFLLQTLTASGAAALLLAVKALFRDKLSPVAVRRVGVLALVLLLPAGGGGRYALFNWPLWVESAKTALTGDYSLTRVLAPIPLPLGLGRPASPADLLYLLYLAGAAALLLRYALSYLRLRLALRQGAEADGAQIRRVAAAYGCRLPCRAVAVPGLSSAFVCGVFRPVLALPAERPVDDKVILHELLHLRCHDAAWGLLICLFRCLHWCNPLLWICADLAQNDAESLCDQRVLERLEGEERRDYGRILLSMADDRYARAPGTSSMANGGRNIRARIQAIARFRRYPAGMALVSVCIAAVLALPALFRHPGRGRCFGFPTLGRRPGFPDRHGLGPGRPVHHRRRGAGRLWKGGPGAKRHLPRPLRPLEEHPALAAEMEAAATGPDHWVYTRWESGLPGYPDPRAGYFLQSDPDSGGYRALMVFPLQWAYPDGPDQPPPRTPTAFGSPPGLSGLSAVKTAGWSFPRRRSP